MELVFPLFRFLSIIESGCGFVSKDALVSVRVVRSYSQGYTF